MTESESTQYTPPPDATAGDYEEIEREVDLHFKGVWPDFLRAIRNPAQVLHFILNDHFGGDEARFAEWTESKGFPAGWLSRFHLALAGIKMQGNSP